MSVTIDGREYSWNQPICVACWNARPANAERQAVPEQGSLRFISGEVERCSYCGGGTASGILVRDDPRTVPFPQFETDGYRVDEADRPLLPLSDSLTMELRVLGHQRTT